MRHRSRLLLLGALLVVLCMLATLPAVRKGYAALLILADLGHVNLPLAGERPSARREQISWEDEGGKQDADLYRPDRSPRAGMVLVPGAAVEGRNDPRLVEFATTLCRSGFVIVVPDIPSLRNLEPSPESAGRISSAFSFMRDETDHGSAAWLGIGAFSVAVGPAVIAALDPAIRPQVGFLLLVGGYHDLERTLAYLTTGYFQEGEHTAWRSPNVYGKWVYALSNAQRLPDPSDRAILSALARRRIADPDAPIDDLHGSLRSGGLAVYDFITNSDPAKVSNLMGRLPSSVRQDIEALNLAQYDLAELQARVFLVHGLDDDIIPYTESISLAAALPPGQARLYLLEGLHHVDSEIIGTDAWRMWRVFYELLSPGVP